MERWFRKKISSIALTHQLDLYGDLKKKIFQLMCICIKVSTYGTYAQFNISYLKKRRLQKARITSYADSILSMYKMDDVRDFQDRSRIKKHIFEALVIKLAPYSAYSDQIPACMEMYVENQLVMYVKYFATHKTLQGIEDIFGGDCIEPF